MEQTVHQTIRSQEKNPGNIVRSVTSIRLGVDAERADEQDSEEGLADTLKEIVKRTVPSPLYAKYHEQHLQRFLSRLGAYTARQASCIQAPQCCSCSAIQLLYHILLLLLLFLFLLQPHSPRPQALSSPVIAAKVGCMQRIFKLAVDREALCV